MVCMCAAGTPATLLRDVCAQAHLCVGGVATLLFTHGINHGHHSVITFTGAAW